MKKSCNSICEIHADPMPIDRCLHLVLVLAYHTSITLFFFGFSIAMANKMTKSQMLKMLADKTSASKKDVVLFLETLTTLACKRSRRSASSSSRASVSS